jgi:hypothetical protein
MPAKDLLDWLKIPLEGRKSTPNEAVEMLWIENVGF